jgi:hypothetical protein
VYQAQISTINSPDSTAHMICVRLVAAIAAAALMLLLLLSPHQGPRAANAQRIRDGAFGSSAMLDMDTQSVRVGTQDGEHSQAIGHYCRMEKGAEHAACGLPYELSNFQGEVIV